MNLGYKELNVYKESYSLAMNIFELTKEWPKEEKYSLIDQIRRSSRAVCSNIAEGYRKRQYPAYFSSKVSDADMENTETQVWLDFSLSCQYITQPAHQELINKTKQIGRMLHYLILNPEKFQDRK
ncbi:MAG TPA: four helix bundle protein [Bacteroidales bacterium]|nr:four helix bundle protein [Bacteroidales bacterium]